MNTFWIRCYRTAGTFAVLLIFLSSARSALAETTDPGGGIGGTGITGFGVVQKFGSVFVNGREYFFDDNTRIAHDGDVIGKQMLHLGEIVKVEGRFDRISGHSIAVRVDSESALRGKVDTVNAASGTLSVLGQTVHVTSGTLSYEPKNAPLLAQIHRGDSVSVSGFARADGSWLATRITRDAPGETRVVLHGEIQNIDREHGRLRMSGQELIASPGVLPAQLKLGDIVHAAGRYDNTVLRLESVVSARPITGPAGRIVEMSGYIQAPPRAGQFVSNDVVFTYSDASTFIGGTATDLRTDLPIAVRGELQSDGAVAVRAILVGVEPMRVTLPELDTGAPRADGEVRAGHGAAEKSDHEKPEMEQRGVEKREINRPERPEVEKPEIERPEIERPEIERPEIEIPSTD